MSYQRIRPWAIALVLVILLSSIAACGAGNPLLGKWEDEEEGMIIEFKDDNTFSIGAMDFVIMEGTYKMSGNQVTLSVPDEDEEIILKYTVSGDKLTLTDPDGEALTFTKVK